MAAFESARGGAVERRRGKQGGLAVRMPCGAGRAWGLASTGGRRPDRVPVDRGARGQRALFRPGAGGTGSLTCGTWLAAVEGGSRERHGACVG
jgi:hypothetical protein